MSLTSSFSQLFSQSAAQSECELVFARPRQTQCAGECTPSCTPRLLSALLSFIVQKASKNAGKVALAEPLAAKQKQRGEHKVVQLAGRAILLVPCELFWAVLQAVLHLVLPYIAVFIEDLRGCFSELSLQLFQLVKLSPFVLIPNETAEGARRAARQLARRQACAGEEAREGAG